MESVLKPHHIQQEFCLNRPRYRQGHKLTSVKVYTVNDESKYLMVFGVSDINIEREFTILCQKYGQLVEIKQMKNYPTDEFTTVFQVQYKFLRNAIFAKKKLDGLEFYGNILHVCYSPEFENIDDVREKLIERRRSIRNGTSPGNIQSKTNYTKKYKSKRLLKDLLKEENLPGTSSGFSSRKYAIDKANSFVEDKCSQINKDDTTKDQLIIKTKKFDKSSEINFKSEQSYEYSKNLPKRIKVLSNSKNLLMYKNNN